MKMMNLFLLITIILLTGCEKRRQLKSNYHHELDGLRPLLSNSLNYQEQVYLPIYADVYHVDQSRLFPLTATISLRNTSKNDSVYIYELNYYNTKGEILKEYIVPGKGLPLGPLETYDLVIHKKAYKGGTGTNFIVGWGRKTGKAELLVQAVMVSTSGQQGLSFITEGHVIETSRQQNTLN